MFGPWTIPSVGEVQLAWIPNPPLTIPPSAAASAGEDDQDMVMDSAPADSEAPPVRKDGPHDMDYDVAEDDSWGVE